MYRPFFLPRGAEVLRHFTTRSHGSWTIEVTTVFDLEESELFDTCDEVVGVYFEVLDYNGDLDDLRYREISRGDGPCFSEEKYEDVISQEISWIHTDLESVASLRGDDIERALYDARCLRTVCMHLASS